MGPSEVVAMVTRKNKMAAKYVEFDRKPNFIPKFPKIGLAIGACAFAVWPATEGHRSEWLEIKV